MSRHKNIFLLLLVTSLLLCASLLLYLHENKNSSIQLTKNEAVATSWFTVYRIKAEVLEEMGLYYEQDDLVVDIKNKIATRSLTNTSKTKKIVVTLQDKPNTTPEIPSDRVILTEIGNASIQDKDTVPTAVIEARNTLLLINFQKGEFDELEINTLLRAFYPI